MIKFPFNEVEGLLSDADKVALRDLARECGKLQGAMVEIGSYKGLSALCILEGGVGPLYCLDYFEDDKWAEFTENLGKSQWWRCRPLRGDFRQLFKLVILNPICFIFVDHDHQLETTKAAYELAWPRLIEGGLLVFHDVGHKDYPEATEFILSLPHKRHFEGLGIIAFKKE